MLVFGKVCDFGCLEAAIHDRRQRVRKRPFAWSADDRLSAARSGQSPLALSFPESGHSPRPNENARSAGVLVLAA